MSPFLEWIGHLLVGVFSLIYAIFFVVQTCRGKIKTETDWMIHIGILAGLAIAAILI